MSYDTATIEKCLEQIDLLAFKDEHGHPLRNSEAFIRLVELAERSEPYIATTYASFEEYRQMSAGEKGPDVGTVFLGKFMGRMSDIRQYLESKEVGYICLNRERDLKRVLIVTPEMSKKETERLARIKQLKAELASLEK